MEYKLIIAGGRDFSDLDRALANVRYLLQRCPEGSEVSIVSGMARGADRVGVLAAKELGLQLHKFPADWDKHGRGAGYRRNADMAKFADALLAFWDGKSRGTKHMIETMREAGKPTLVLSYGPDEG